ncbi:class I SAM-dependent methyltransferase [Breoghania sp.]|uniref:class I SAM-dependent methyltransferase n=1 Tax=Breoghania sp. TaxID=2065378 RepID=UPI0029CA33C3|nr:class I SAM-dependent methyltransferase [Breoghania sp.]
MSDGHLHRYFLNNGEYRLHKWLHYFDIYERHFSRFVDKKPTILEIGVAGGGSLKMWQNYFGEGANIIGIDIKPECKQYEGENIEIFIGSQDDEELLNSICAKYPKIDIVLDDGSHMMRHMKKSFEVLYPRVSDNGVYVVEDTHTCYWNEYEGGLGVPGSFIEFAKAKIDEINAVHSREAVQVTDFTRRTDSICFYDSVVVFEKRKQGLRQAAITAPML